MSGGEAGMRDVLLSQAAPTLPDLSNVGKQDEQVRCGVLTCVGSLVKMFAAWLKEVSTLLKRPLWNTAPNATSALTTMLTAMISFDIILLRS